jgi:hypothetical protein
MDAYPRLSIWTAISLVAVFFGVAAVSAASATSASYVSLGDSYTSGPGVEPQAPGTPTVCTRSQVNYPHLVAAALDLELHDVSCSGATTQDFSIAQHPEVPPQFNALSPTTEVVSVMIGANDENIFATTWGCNEYDRSVLQQGGRPCARRYRTSVKSDIQRDAPVVREALARIHQLSPDAKVFVIGYPEQVPKGSTCYSQISMTPGDATFVNSMNARLDSMVRRVTSEEHDHYVNLLTPSHGHNGCQPFGVRWVEPWIHPVEGAKLHPNALGHEEFAHVIESVMRESGVTERQAACCVRARAVAAHLELERLGRALSPSRLLDAPAWLAR